jgi:hypothetical protein
MIIATTTAHTAKAIKLYVPISAYTFEGKPKIPAPIIPLIAIATRSHRLMPRISPSSDTFFIALPYNRIRSPRQSNSNFTLSKS